MDPYETFETESVRTLGEQIGYGRVMHLCEKLWGEYLKDQGLPNREFSVGCRAELLVPCPGLAHKRDAHCDWCCDSGRVTQKVAWAMSRLEPPT